MVLHNWSARRFLCKGCVVVAAAVIMSQRAGAEPEQGAAFQASIERLRLVQQALARGDRAEAKAACTAVIQAADSLAHHHREAEERLAEIERLEKGLPARDPTASRLALPSRQRPALVLFVAPDGNDAQPGNEAQPFRSLERARDEMRSLRQSGKLPEGGVEVVLRGGQYQTAQTFKLTAEDSGTEQSPIVYRAADGEQPRFSGGVRLSGFRPIEDAQVLARLPEEARGKTLCLDLKKLGIGPVKPLVLGGFQSGRGFQTHPVPELFFDGRAMTLARWPNEGFVLTGETWGPTIQHAWGPPASQTGQFKFDNDRMMRWVGEKDLWLHGYWCWAWADCYEQVASIDPNKREIILSPPYHLYGYRQGQRFYVLNALSEIDAPGEWYLDRSDLMLYFWPPSDPGKVDVWLSLNDFPFIRMQQVSHLALEGLVWEYGAGDAIMVQGGEHCRLAGCTVRHCGGNGITVSGGTAHSIVSCDIYSLGRGGVSVSGGDRKTLVPAAHVIENCHIHDLSRIDRTYTPGVVVDGVGNRVAHCLFHDIASSAIRVGGNDHLIEYNEALRVVAESDDQGATDMFGDPTYRGNVYRFNYWHEIASNLNHAEGLHIGQGGIRLDDAISGVLIYGNVFHRVPQGESLFGGVQIHGGKDNIVDNNVFVECEAAVSFSPWDESRWRAHVQNYFPKPDLDVELYLKRYPALAQLQENNNRNTIARNLVVRCKAFLLRDDAQGKRNEVIDNLETADDPGFRNLSAGDFQLDDASSAAAQIGLRPIPFDEIGLYVDTFRKMLPEHSHVRVGMIPSQTN